MGAEITCNGLLTLMRVMKMSRESRAFFENWTWAGPSSDVHHKEGLNESSNGVGFFV